MFFMLNAQIDEQMCVPTVSNNVDAKKMSKKTLISRSIKKHIRKLETKKTAQDASTDADSLVVFPSTNVNSFDIKPARSNESDDPIMDQLTQTNDESLVAKKSNTKFNRNELERTIIVKNLAADTPVKQLLSHLKLTSKSYESVRERSLPIDKKFAGKKFSAIKAKKFSCESSKNCYILLHSKELVPFVMQQNGTLLNNRHLFIDRVYVKDKKALFDPFYSIFVGMLKPTDDEESVYQAFSKFGSIKNIRLVRHPVTRASKCFAYVLFDSKASVRLAIKHFSSKKENQPYVVSRVEKLSVQNSQKEEKLNEKVEKKKSFKEIHKAKKLVIKLNKNAKKKIKRKLALE